jgi:hypothetical protein
MAAAMKATVLIPTHDHGPTLRYAAAAALQQTARDLEVFVIGDGVSDQGREVIAELVRSDPRVRFFDHPKHERRGEPYRHAALREARGEIVCYLTDRDLWFPDHVQRMLALLQNADFASAFSLHLRPNDEAILFPMDLSQPIFRAAMLAGKNGVAFSCAAHTLAMYRRLPHGWRTTPAGLATDLYMFQQFLALPDCRAASGFWPTVLTFPSPPRKEWPVEKRVEELEQWSRQIASPQERRALRMKLLELAVANHTRWIAAMFQKQEELARKLLDQENSPAMTSQAQDEFWSRQGSMKFKKP